MSESKAFDAGQSVIMLRSAGSRSDKRDRDVVDGELRTIRRQTQERSTYIFCPRRSSTIYCTQNAKG